MRLILEDDDGVLASWDIDAPEDFKPGEVKDAVWAVLLSKGGIV